eukprot:scaffold18454_cov51-Attheya_sp.AAC.1
MAILTMMAGGDQEAHYSTGEDSYHSYDDDSHSTLSSEDEESESDVSGLSTNVWGEDEREEYEDTSSEESEEHQDQAERSEKQTVPCVFRREKTWRYCHGVGLRISFANPV